MTLLPKQIIYFYDIRPNDKALQGCNPKDRTDASVLRLMVNEKPTG
jgi:hypothetical protein